MVKIYLHDLLQKKFSSKSDSNLAVGRKEKRVAEKDVMSESQKATGCQSLRNTTAQRCLLWIQFSPNKLGHQGNTPTLVLERKKFSVA